MVGLGQVIFDVLEVFSRAQFLIKHERLFRPEIDVLNVDHVIVCLAQVRIIK